MKHLLYLKELNQRTISRLLAKAETFLSTNNFPPPQDKNLQGITLANLFLEPSTRTRSSFQIAAKRLGADVLNIDEQHSSRTKGETIIDTIRTLEAMGVNYFVVRHKERGILSKIVANVDLDSHVINGGESVDSHPTQGLLDLLTIKKHKKGFDQIKVAIVGDIKHSRVARSLAEGLATMAVKTLTLIAPEEFKPDMKFYPNAEHCKNLDQGLVNADVVVALRVQRERIESLTETISPDHYFEKYGLTMKRLEPCNDDVIVMHPGPMNRGVEISDEVADGANSVIREQITNGIAIRMALLSMMQAEVMK
ncbi:MAG: aspartate carbamoyltransferase catalytic subunit [Gammaproteobacteria bacterium]|nr:aspartate carbamoyltransferase catalytic subunit [Gammaproteobacteria bacterium]